MKSFVLLFFVIIQSSLVASELNLERLNQIACKDLLQSRPDEQHIKTNPSLHFKSSSAQYFLRRSNQGMFYQIEKWDHDFSINSIIELDSGISKIKDFIVHADHIWTVSAEGLLKLDMQGKVLASFQKVGMKFRSLFLDEARGKIYLAAWTSGLLVFDIASENFTESFPLNTYQDNGQSSAAVSLTGNSDRILYVVMTGNSPLGFNGVVAFDLEDSKMLNQAQYDRRRWGVIDTDATVYLMDDYVVINNGGWIHRFTQDDLLAKKTIRPNWRAIAHREGDYYQYIMLRGDFIFNEGEILGCGLYAAMRSGSTPLHFSKSFSIKLEK